MQDAIVRAHATWATGDAQGSAPDDVEAWLYVAARNRLIDLIRSDTARRERERRYASELEASSPGPRVSEQDDSLTLLFLCCHPALSEASQVALTLRSVGGLSTAEIAAAFLVPETTMAQRISRAKQRLADSGATFGAVGPEERAARMAAVRSVLYAIFSEGHAATVGADLIRTDLCHEGIRLTRLLHALAPADRETSSLLALMLLTDARRPARVTADGDFVPLDEQDRTRWNRDAIAEGAALLLRALGAGPAGAYAIQAAIAAIHCEAPSAEETDWPQIAALYTLLAKVAPSPMVTLNQIVALAMVDGPSVALARLGELARDPGLSGHRRVRAVRAHLLERAGRTPEAVDEYRAAARAATNLPERRYLLRKAAELASPLQSP